MGDLAIIRSILRTMLDAEKAQSSAVPFSDERRVFADARSEHERGKGAERRYEGADPDLRKSSGDSISRR
jgi:hypothetical protein